jgi:hypothetical protein
MRNFFDSPAGKITVFVLFAIMIGIAFALYRSSGTDVAAFANHRMFIDATTGQPFAHELQIGERFPIDAPSGSKSGYPTELCYWTADGQVTKDPTYVLLNSYIGKREPTFCPVCKRLVVPHNPEAVQGSSPPPTEQEWKRLHGQ